MSSAAKQVRAAVEARLAEATVFLKRLIATPSLPGEEHEAMDAAADAFARLGEVGRVSLDNSLRDDPLYSDPIPDMDYAGRSNVVVTLGGIGGGRRLLLNTHLDTVPPSEGQPYPYEPVERDGEILGRGACDAKGQAATIWLAMAALKDLGVAAGDVVAHLVVEEEVGGNGTLAMARRGEKADGCIVLEPTETRVLTSIRGAVWFRVTLRGKPGHSGQAGVTRSALDKAMRVVEILRGYHERLRELSRGDELFDRYENPMPLTIGKLVAGNWPSTAPGEATLEGVLGLLPSRTAQQVMDEMTSVIRDEGGPEIADDFDIHFMYKHDCSVCPTDHPLARSLQASAREAGGSGEIDAMTASCDACFYSGELGIPTVVFGGGSLSVAHSNHERMPLAELARAGEAIATTALDFCERT